MKHIDMELLNLAQDGRRYAVKHLEKPEQEMHHLILQLWEDNLSPEIFMTFWRAGNWSGWGNSVDGCDSN